MPNKSSVTKRSDRKPTKKVVRGGVGKTSSSMPKESLFKKDISLHLSERIGILRRLKHGWIRLYRRYKALFGKHTVVRFFTSVVLLVVIFFGIWAVLETIEYKVMEHRLNSLTDSIVDVLGEPDERAVTKGCYASPSSFGVTGTPSCGYGNFFKYNNIDDTDAFLDKAYNEFNSYLLFNKTRTPNTINLRNSEIKFKTLPYSPSLRCSISGGNDKEGVFIFLSCFGDALLYQFPAEDR